MSFRTSLFIVALGLIAGLAPGYSLGQVGAEDQPGQEEGRVASGDSGEGHQSDAVDLFPALEGIESAIRDLIANEDKVVREAAQDREKRDLQAQEEMAFWAEGMFYATFATVILTFIALFAIFRTLHHTRRAADYTEGMLVEAKTTTKAAEASILETRRIGEAQVRAYVIPKQCCVKIQADGDMIRGQIIATLANSGQTPAEIEGFAVRHKITGLGAKRGGGQMYGGRKLGVSGSFDIVKKVNGGTVGQNVAGLSVSIQFEVIYRYVDVFGQVSTETARWKVAENVTLGKRYVTVDMVQEFHSGTHHDNVLMGDLEETIHEQKRRLKMP